MHERVTRLEEELEVAKADSMALNLVEVGGGLTERESADSSFTTTQSQSGSFSLITRLGVSKPKTSSEPEFRIEATRLYKKFQQTCVQRDRLQTEKTKLQADLFKLNRRMDDREPILQRQKVEYEKLRSDIVATQSDLEESEKSRKLWDEEKQELGKDRKQLMRDLKSIALHNEDLVRILQNSAHQSVRRLRDSDFWGKFEN